MTKYSTKNNWLKGLIIVVAVLGILQYEASQTYEYLNNDKNTDNKQNVIINLAYEGNDTIPKNNTNNATVDEELNWDDADWEGSSNDAIIKSKEELAEAQERVEKLDKTIAEQEKIIAKTDKEIAEQEKIIAKTDKEIAEQEKIIAEQEKEIAEQEKLIEQLQKEKNN